MPQADRDADRRVRIQQIAARIPIRLDRLQRHFGVAAAGAETRVRRHVRRQRAGRLERRHPAREPRRIFVREIIEVALEIARDLDIHRRAQRRSHRSGTVDARIEIARKDVVLVGGQHQPLDRQPHAAGHVTGEDVAKVSGRHAEAHLLRAGGLLNTERRVKIVDDLRENAGPVDGVDRAQPAGIAERQIVEEILDDVLAIVEGAFDSQVADVIVQHRGHLAFLHRADPALRVHHEDADARAAAHAVDRGAAGVAAGRRDNVQFAARLAQRIFEEVAEKLQRDILEGEGRPVKQLQQVDRPDLHHRRDFGMAEGRVTARHDAAQGGVRDVVRKEPDDLEREILVAQRAPSRQAVADIGDGRRQIQPAVASQAGENGLLKRQRLAAAAGAHIAHVIQKTPGAGS